jgi:hypothetical protein
LGDLFDGQNGWKAGVHFVSIECGFDFSAA